MTGEVCHEYLCSLNKSIRCADVSRKRETSGPGNILRQVQSQIGIQQILLDKLNGTVPIVILLMARFRLGSDDKLKDGK